MEQNAAVSSPWRHEGGPKELKVLKAPLRQQLDYLEVKKGGPMAVYHEMEDMEREYCTTTEEERRRDKMEMQEMDEQEMDEQEMDEQEMDEQEMDEMDEQEMDEMQEYHLSEEAEACEVERKEAHAEVAGGVREDED